MIKAWSHPDEKTVNHNQGCQRILQFLFEPKGWRLVIVWWDDPSTRMIPPDNSYLAFWKKIAWVMIVLIWVHHFVTSKTTSFSECQILSINFKWKKKTIYSKIHYGSRGRKVTDWRTIDDHESTDSAVRSKFARVRQIPIWNRLSSYKSLNCLPLSIWGHKISD